MKKLLPMLLILTTPLIMCAESSEQTLDSGHSGPVLALAWDEGRSLLFSGGRDGSLRIWDSEPLRLIRKIQITDLPIRKIELNPKSTEIALVQSDGISQHILSVWNWQSGERRFSAALPEIPLVLNFSPLGNFVVVSKTGWKSLTFFDSSTGKTLPFLQEGFGIVSFLIVSASENTLVSYSPSSGAFVYWDLKPGIQKQTVRSVPELKNLKVFNMRYAAGTLGQDMVVVDLVTGAVTASVREEGIQSLAVSSRGEIATIAARGSETFLQTWVFEPPASGFSRGVLYRTGDQTRRIPSETSDLLFAKEKIFLALRDGGLGAIDGSFGTLSRAGINLLDPVFDLLGRDGDLHLVTKKKIYTFSSDLFTVPPDKKIRASRLTASAAPNPFASDAGILESGSGDIFLWQKAPDIPGRIARIDPITGTVLSLYDSFSLPLSTVRESENFLYCLERNGSLKKIDAAVMQSSYEYPAWGIHTVVPVGGRLMLAGKSRSGVFSSPLVSINAFTGETASVDSPPAFIVFAIEYDARKNRVYYAGLEKTGEDKTVTKLYTADLSRPGNASAIATADSSDIDADIHIDSESSVLYTTLGNAARKWDGSRWTNFQPANAVAAALRDHGLLLLGINTDGSVSVWEKSSGRLIGTIYILEDGNWIAVRVDGYYLSSHGPEETPPLTAVRDGRPLTAEENRDFRLTLDD